MDDGRWMMDDGRWEKDRRCEGEKIEGEKLRRLEDQKGHKAMRAGCRA